MQIFHVDGPCPRCGWRIVKEVSAIEKAKGEIFLEDVEKPRLAVACRLVMPAQAGRGGFEPYAAIELDCGCEVVLAAITVVPGEEMPRVGRRVDPGDRMTVTQLARRQEVLEIVEDWAAGARPATDDDGYTPQYPSLPSGLTPDDAAWLAVLCDNCRHRRGDHRGGSRTQPACTVGVCACPDFQPTEPVVNDEEWLAHVLQQDVAEDRLGAIVQYAADGLIDQARAEGPLRNMLATPAEHAQQQYERGHARTFLQDPVAHLDGEDPGPATQAAQAACAHRFQAGPPDGDPYCYRCNRSKAEIEGYPDL